MIWEYKSVSRGVGLEDEFSKFASDLAVLNYLGQFRWELIAVDSSRNSGIAPTMTYWFKRPYSPDNS